MSTSLEGAAELALANRVNLYSVVAPAALLVYDFIILLPDEVRYFWTGRLSLTSFLFFVNRYLWLGLAPFTLWTKLAQFSDETSVFCSAISLFRQFLPLLAHTIIACVFVMRIYALFQRSNKIIIFCTILAGILIPVCAWVLLRTPNSPSTSACTGIPDNRTTRGFIVAWSLVIVYDIVIFCLTLLGARRLRSTLKLKFTGVQQYVKPPSLVELVFRDGFIYFLIMLSANIVNVLVLVFAPQLYKINSTHPVYSISIVMLSRLMLNLRGADEKVFSDYGHVVDAKSTIYCLTTVNGFGNFEGDQDMLEEAADAATLGSTSTSTNSTNV